MKLSFYSIYVYYFLKKSVMKLTTDWKLKVNLKVEKYCTLLIKILHDFQRLIYLFIIELHTIYNYLKYP